ELEPEDVLDSTLLRAYDQFVKDPARGDIRRWLLQLALDQIDAEIRRVKQEHQENVPAPADEEDEEIIKLYQPNDLLNLENMVPDLLVPSPEEEMERSEL